MNTALSFLERDGVLAGLNISAVAKEVGVTPANVYHYFGSRQGLLRAAINHRIFTQTPPGQDPPPDLTSGERAMGGFNFVADNPEVCLKALLPLDGDKEYEIDPYFERARIVLERDAERGHLRQDVDPEVMFLALVASAFGCILFRESAARQLGITGEELQRRMLPVFEKMVAAFVANSDDAEQDAPQS
jgi:AcrR family transcriptional regulator